MMESRVRKMKMSLQKAHRAKFGLTQLLVHKELMFAKRRNIKPEDPPPSSDTPTYIRVSNQQA